MNWIHSVACWKGLIGSGRHRVWTPLEGVALWFFPRWRTVLLGYLWVMSLSRALQSLTKTSLTAAIAATAALAWSTVSATAFVVELKDVAADRVERQRAEAIGQIPLPNTPNIGRLTERLAEKKLVAGSAVMIRIFKAESELELWMQRGNKFELFAVYPMCHWSGTLGPKVNEGDKQSPEGVYTVSAKQLHLIGRHPRSLNLGFPNALDRQFSRTGSYILIHGGCGSVGCFAMTNPVIEEIFSLTQAAIKSGQDAVQVHAFPFRMTEERLKAHALNEWYDFWRNLKDVYDSFDRTRRPPRVTVCEGRYWVDDALKPGEVAPQSPLAVCGASLAAVGSPNSETDSATTANLEKSSPKVVSWSPHLGDSINLSQPPSSQTLRLITPSPIPHPQLATGASWSNGPAMPSHPSVSASSRPGSSPRLAGSLAGPPHQRLASSTTIAPVQISCNVTRPSCRKWAALHRQMAIDQLRESVEAKRLAAERYKLRLASRR